MAIGEAPPAYSEYIREYGYEARLLTEAFALVGLTVEYTFYPWKRAYIATQDGDFDAAGCWFKNDERVRDGFLFSDPVEDLSLHFFSLKSTPFDWKTLDDLAGLNIGITLGYTYPDDFLKAGKDGLFTLDQAPKDEFNFRKLEAGRIDLFPIVPNMGYGILRKIFPPETVDLFTYHPTPLFLEGTSYLLFAPQTDPALIEKFNQGLKQLKESGRFDEIRKEAEEGKYPLMDTKWTP